MFYSATTGGFYTTGHKIIPPDAVEITDQEHQVLLAANSAGANIEADANGYPIAVQPQISIDDIAAAAMAKVNIAAGVAREKYITASPGQELVYMKKEEQARSFAAAGYTGTTPVFVSAEAAATGLSDQGACDSIIAKADQWIVIGAQIDQARRTASVQIEAARAINDSAAIIAARDAAISAIQAL